MKLGSMMRTGLVAAGLVAGAATSAFAQGAPIKIGILSNCEGPFATFFEATASGANLALNSLTATSPGPTPCSTARLAPSGTVPSSSASAQLDTKKSRHPASSSASIVSRAPMP